MLALDIAKNLGYAIDYSNNELVVGTINGDPIFQLRCIYNFIPAVEEIVIEQLNAFNSPNPKTLTVLAQRVGYLTYSLQENYNVIFKTPAQWRSYLNIKNNKTGSKELQSQIEKTANIYLNIDETDALGLWLCTKQLQVDDLSKYTLVKAKKLNAPSNKKRNQKSR